MNLEQSYSERYEEHLVPCARRLEEFLRMYCSGQHRIDRISARAKAIDRFIAKSEKTLPSGELKYANPLEDIQDQIGARIVVFYLEDVEAVRQTATEYLRTIEDVKIIPESTNSFGYEGSHLIAFIPTDVVGESTTQDLPKVFELQIKTLFQHAWAEANHDLAYKPGEALSDEHLRLNALVAAQAWGADRIFQQLRESISNSVAVRDQEQEKGSVEAQK